MAIQIWVNTGLLVVNGAWQHQAIIWINVNFFTKVFCGIHMKEISLQMPKIFILGIAKSLKIIEIIAASPRDQWVNQLLETEISLTSCPTSNGQPLLELP